MSKNKHSDNFRNKFLQKPGFLTKPVSRKEFKRELKSMRHLEFGPQQRQLEAEKRASNLQQQRIGDWFPQYLQQIGRLNSQTNAAYDQAAQATQQDSANSSAYAEKLRQRVASENRADAAKRGATYSPAVDQTAVQANVARQQSANSFTGLIRSQGATSNAYMLDKKRIGKGEEINQLLGEAARGRQVNQDLHDLNQQKQDFADKFINELRPQERDFYLGLLQAKLGNKQAKLSASTSRANARLSARTSIANSKRTAQSSRISSRRSLKSAMASLRERQRNDKISHKEFLKEQARIRHEWQKSHTKHGNPKATAGGGSSGNGNPRKHQVNRMLQELKAGTKHGAIVDSHGKPVPRAQVIQQLISHSQSSTRHQARIALNRWHKWLDKHPHH